MKLGINQAYFLPYIGYFQLIKSVDKFILYDLLNFKLRSWMNRNRILERSSGAAVNIIVPVANKSAHQLIVDTKLADNKDYMIRKMLKQVKHNYSKATFFNEVFPFLEKTVLSVDSIELNRFNGSIIKIFCEYLDISTEIQIENSSYLEMERGLRKNDDFGGEGDASLLPRKVRRAILICRKEGANTFINLPGGQSIYNPKIFADEGIDFRFISPPTFKYNQFDQPFISHLSIIDVLMHCGQKKTVEMINDYKFI